MQEHKIIILGAMGAGKTTAIQSIVDGKVVSTDVTNTDETVKKSTTTVAMDYGDLPLPNGDRLRIFGAPGQQRFDFLWPTLARGSAGGIILVDAEQGNTVENLTSYLSVLKNKNISMPVIVGVTKADLISSKQLENIKSGVSQKGYQIPLMACDAREKKSVMLLIDTLMCEIETQELLKQIS